MLLKLKSELSPQSPGVKPLCPIHWTVRTAVEWETRGNFSSQWYSGDIHFFFGVAVAEKLFSITDTLSRAIQKISLCACEAKKMAEVTISSLKDHRSDTCFKHFYEDTKKKASDLGVDELTLPWSRRAPLCLDTTASNTHQYDNVEDSYRKNFLKFWTY